MASKSQRLFKWSLGLSLLLVLARFLPFIWGKSILLGDNFSLMVPGKLFTAHWIRQGILPLWNPTILGGISWVGDINQSIFHPSTILFLFFPPDLALNLLILGLLILSYLGVFRLTNLLKFSYRASLITGLLWTLSPVMMGYVSNIALIQTASLFPWLVWAGLRLDKGRRAFWRFLFILSLQILSGYPIMVVYSLITTFILFVSHHWPSYLKLRSKKITIKTLTQLPTSLIHKHLKLWFWAVFLALGLTAFTWLPFLETLAGSTRSIQTSEQLLAGGAHPIELIKLILPNFFNNSLVGYKWGAVWSRSTTILPYITWYGGVVLAFYLFSFKKWQRQDKVYLSFLIVSLILAVSSPIYSLLMSNLPLLGQARGPGTWLMISSLCLALLVGRAFDSLKIDKRTLRWVTGLSLGLFLTTYLVYTLVFVNFPYVWQSLDTWVGSRLSGSEFHTLIRDQIIIKAILVDLLLALFCLMTSVWAWGQKRYWIILVCIMLDLTWQTRGLVLFGPGRVYRQEEAVKTVQPLLDNINTRQYRILTQNYNHSYTGFDAYFDAISLRAPFSDSYVTPSEMTTYNHAAQLKAGLTPDWNMPANLPIIHGYTTLLPLDIAKQFAHDKTELGINQLDEIKLDDPYLRNWSVGYYLEDSWFNLSWETRHLPVIKEFGRWQLKKLPQTYARFRFETYEPVQLDSFRETPNHLWLSLTNRKNYDTLVMADRYDRNWQATVNDRQVDVSRLDNIRKLPVEPEINTVEIWYAPRMFYLGLVFSGLTFFILVYRLEKRY